MSYEGRIGTLLILCLAQLACASPEMPTRHHVLPTDPQRSLMLAASIGDVELATLALDAGAQVNARGDAGRTALMLAAQGQREALAKLLLGRGADATMRDADGHTAMWHARGITLNARIPFTRWHSSVFLRLPRFVQTDTAAALEQASN